MELYSYLMRLETLLRSRQDLEIEVLEIKVRSLEATIKGEIGFYDHSHLSLFEQVRPVGKHSCKRINYKFHYQSATGHLLFRYDNAPHHPHLSLFPFHKHIGDSVVAATPPDLHEVLSEIDVLLYPP